MENEDDTPIARLKDQRTPNTRYVKLVKNAYVLLPAGYKKITAMAADGHGTTTMRAVLQIGKEGWHNLMKRDELAREALDHGLAALEDETAAVIVGKMREGNLLAAFAIGKMRFGWSEGKAAGAVTPQVNVQINMPAAMSDAQFQRLIDAQPQALIAVDPPE